MAAIMYKPNKKYTEKAKQLLLHVIKLESADMFTEELLGPENAYRLATEAKRILKLWKKK